jgi:ABC-type transporter Mla maintaining outer membrane lipid asymmetry ATPase subunit MlaF
MWNPNIQVFGNAVYRPLAVATIDAVALKPSSTRLPDDEMPNQMITRRTLARTLVTLGCVKLLVAATLHCLAAS